MEIEVASIFVDVLFYLISAILSLCFSLFAGFADSYITRL